MSKSRRDVEFKEASTIFDDPLSSTIADPDQTIEAREMRAEYDFSAGVRGKYVDRYRRGINVVLIDPELADVFPESKSVNDALRALVAIATRADSRKRA
jgi:hypothetical protein